MAARPERGPDSVPGRSPPYSLEAEQAVLGALLLGASAWDRVAGLLEDGDFYDPRHRLVFRTIAVLHQEHQVTDLITLSDRLRGGDQLEEGGGLDYLAALVENAPEGTNIRAHALVVRENSVRRALIEAGGGILESAYNTGGRSMAEVLDRAEQGIFEIARQRKRGQESYRPFTKILAPALERIDTLYKTKSTVTGLETGFNDLDNLTAGLQETDLIVLAGRPSMGKTALAVNIAEHAALKHGKRVLLFSMEMSAQQLAIRMLASLARVDQQRIRTGRLSEENWERLFSTAGQLQNVSIFVDDTPGQSPTAIRSTCRRLVREEGGLDLVLIDYLQLMQVTGSKENRATEISEISRSLKNMARELEVPVVALSQLNRSVEQRPDKRPVMSDLRESGAIEQDADLVLFIYRDEVYHEDSEQQGVAEIIVAKQRNGPIGTVRLAFLGRYTRFEDLLSEARVPLGAE